ncbi:twin-arginine translocase TatA/TatE family subunit [Kangiella koreensis]|uniref:Sec-independent protein translocase protein TatA n=1 Tax=Kangiella koreensis (strain DSM 16069 / JCM 12317 / KCTC 12182 / SW-125) TaxID=523791 RepID=C7R8A7_KANKD|nr:twin-arginine translocase TatA/TatE family subunit [Kangiella koreensis]ACV27672.1 twin-arginine translocation protein, TatA/E family subunit [Kangiella koreensis DSM 16069]
MKPGIWELLILLVIILLLFGTKKLRNAGGDIGSAFKNFKKAVKDEDKQAADKNVEDQSEDADFDNNRPRQEQAEQSSTDNNQDKQS